MKTMKFNMLIPLKSLLILTAIILSGFSSGIANQRIAESYGPPALQVSGKFLNGNQTGIVKLYVWKEVHSSVNMFRETYRCFIDSVKDGRFNFSVDSLDDFSYISLSETEQKGRPMAIINLYRIGQRDSIYVDIHRGILNRNLVSDSGIPVPKYSVRFYGNGSEKYNCRYKLDSLRKVYREEFELNHPSNYLTVMQLSKYRLERAEYITAKLLQFLNGYEKSMPENLYNLLKIDIIAFSVMQEVHPSIRTELYSFYPQADMDSVKTLYLNSSIIKRLNMLPKRIGSFSVHYLKAVVQMLRKELKFLGGNVNVYEVIKERYSGVPRDKLIAAYLSREYSFMPHVQAELMLNDALSIVEWPASITILKLLEHQVVGSALYPFELPDKTGKLVRLRDFKGKVVFIDFFYTGCKNCISYNQNVVSKAKKHFATNQNIVFMTISIDGIKDRWLKSLESGLYTSDQAINLYTGGKGDNHPLIKQLNIFGYPHPILIDRKGNIFNNTYKDLGQGNPQALIDIISRAIKTQE